MGTFHVFLNCTNSTNSRKASHIDFTECLYFDEWINPLLSQCSLLIPLKTSEKERFSDAFRGIKIERWEKYRHQNDNIYLENKLRLRNDKTSEKVEY